MPSALPSALSIAGSDSGAGAGIQADLLTFAAQGVFGTTAITCLTAQNPRGVSGVLPVPPDFVLEQCRQVAGHFHPKALKTGMLLEVGIVEAVARFIQESGIPAVVDPVMGKLYRNQMCGLGGDVTRVQLEGAQSHFTTPITATPLFLPWIKDRLAGAAAPEGCNGG